MFGTIGSGRPSEEDPLSPLSAVMAKTFGKPPPAGLMNPSETPQPYTSPFRISSMHSGGSSSSYSRGASRDLSGDFSYAQSSYNSGMSTANSYGSMSSSAAAERHRDSNQQMHSFSYSHSAPVVQQREPLTAVAKQGLEIESLQKEITRLNQKLARQEPVSIHKLDSATENAFRDLNAKMKTKNDEVQRLELTIEALLAQGSYDESAAYRVCSKMQSLVAENKRLGSMLGAGKALQQEIEIGILRLENETLQKKIDSLTEKKGKE